MARGRRGQPDRPEGRTSHTLARERRGPAPKGLPALNRATPIAGCCNATRLSSALASSGTARDPDGGRDNRWASRFLRTPINPERPRDGYGGQLPALAPPGVGRALWDGSIGTVWLGTRKPRTHPAVPTEPALESRQTTGGLFRIRHSTTRTELKPSAFPREPSRLPRTPLPSLRPDGLCHRVQTGSEATGVKSQVLGPRDRCTPRHRRVVHLPPRVAALATPCTTAPLPRPWHGDPDHKPALRGRENARHPTSREGGIRTPSRNRVVADLGIFPVGGGPTVGRERKPGLPLVSSRPQIGVRIRHGFPRALPATPSDHQESLLSSSPDRAPLHPRPCVPLAGSARAQKSGVRVSQSPYRTGTGRETATG